MGLGAFYDQVTYVWASSASPRHAESAPAETALPRVQRWPSAGLRRGQYAGSALLRNEAVHTVLSGPRAVSSLVSRVGGPRADIHRVKEE